MKTQIVNDMNGCTPGLVLKKTTNTSCKLRIESTRTEYTWTYHWIQNEQQNFVNLAII